MVNEDIVKFISSNLKRGLSYDEINSRLLAHNYSDYDINEARNYLLSGKKLTNKEITYPLYPTKEIKYFLIIFLILIFLIVAVIFGKYILEPKQKEFIVYEENISKEYVINLEKNNILTIYFLGETNNFSIESRSEMLKVVGNSPFSLLVDDSKQIDLNFDKEFDVNFVYLGNNRLLIEKICHEKWICSMWTGCLNGERTRDCKEENNCGTEFEKPTFKEIC